MSLGTLNTLQNLLSAVVVLIATASMLVKALEAIVKILTTFFPSLKGADGELTSVAAWLDAASKSKLLNAFALSPAVAFHASLNPPGTDTTAQAHAVIVAMQPDPVPLTAKKNGGYITPFGQALFAFSFLFMGILVLMLTNCATVGKVAIQCEEQAIQSQLPGITSQVSSILGGNSPQWQDALDTLYATQGAAVICAVEALINGLVGGGAALAPQQQLVLVRGQVWLSTKPAPAEPGSLPHPL